MASKDVQGEYAYPTEKIQSALKRQQDIAARNQDRVHGQDCVKVMEVDSALYHKTRIANQEVYGVDDIWREQEFVDDMMRRNGDLIAVKNSSRNTTISVPGDRLPRTSLGRTRFGPVTERFRDVKIDGKVVKIREYIEDGVVKTEELSAS